MSRKPQTDPRFHDSSDSRCVLHKEARKAGKPARTNRECPRCLSERGFT
jgi:hypothetical protein